MIKLSTAVVIMFYSVCSFTQDTDKYNFSYLKSSFEDTIEKENTGWKAMVDKIKEIYYNDQNMAMGIEKLDDTCAVILGVSTDSLEKFRDKFLLMLTLYNRVKGSLMPDCSYDKKRTAVFVSLLSDYILPSKYKYFYRFYFDYAGLWKRIREDFYL